MLSSQPAEFGYISLSPKLSVVTGLPSSWALVACPTPRGGSSHSIWWFIFIRISWANAHFSFLNHRVSWSAPWYRFQNLSTLFIIRRIGILKLKVEIIQSYIPLLRLKSINWPFITQRQPGEPQHICRLWIYVRFEKKLQQLGFFSTSRNVRRLSTHEIRYFCFPTPH